MASLLKRRLLVSFPPGSFWANLPLSARFASGGQERRTCLYEFHRRREARMESFAGHSMPIVYKNQSIKGEHLQTRRMASAFDVSHMMQTLVKGADRVKFIEKLTVADVAGMPINKCALSLFTNHSGGIIDDCIIANCQDHLYVVSNAGNADTVWKWLNSNLEGLEVSLERLEGRGLIALQGPLAAKVLQAKLLDRKLDLSKIEFMNTFEAELSGSVGLCRITRCGYTGEDGFEVSVEPEKAEQLMESLCSDFGHEVAPAGLGARDTLRLEAGLCLHGHDITAETTPVEAALSWTVHKRRRQEPAADFPGAKLILDQLNNKSARLKRVGLIASEQGGPPAREHSKVLSADGREVLGEVTSGSFAPKLEKNVAMAYLPAEYANKLDQPLNCQIRGRNFEYKITRMPFVKSNYYILPK